MSAPALEVRNLRKAYGGLVVTDDVSLSLAAGARHALIGPNGAGKSTLVGLISGVVPLDSGGVLIAGEDVSRKSSAARTKRGLVRTFQVTSLFPRLTVLENVLLAVCERSGVAARMWRSAASHTRELRRARDIAAKLGLTEELDRRIAEISYGRQRLVEIAIALALEPKVLLLDEPAAGVPRADVRWLLDAIRALPPEIAVLMIEHDMEIVRDFAETVTVLVQGRVLLTDRTSDALRSEKVRAVYLGGKVPAKAKANA